MPALSNHLRLPLARRFQTSIAQAAGRATPSMQKAWDDLGSYNRSDIQTLKSKTSRTVSSLHTASFTAATGFYSVYTGRRARGLHAADIEPDPAFDGPFIAVWRALKQGRGPEEAHAAGRSRIEALAANLANSTARQTGGLYVASAGISHDGWERITDSGACQWCHDVAGDTYDSADSADFGHDRCGCTAVPRI